MKYSFSLGKDEIERVLMHIPVGMLTLALGVFVVWWLGPLFGFGFLVYEIVENKSLKNGAWKDIKGWLWGLGILGIILGILSFMGVLVLLGQGVSKGG